MKLRLATVSDGPELCEVYSPYVERTAISFETMVPSPHEMANRLALTLAAYPWLVAVDDARLLGYAYAHQFAPRAAYRWSVETSVYVRSDAHHTGIGRQLYATLFGILETQGYQEAFAGITLPNMASVAFHEAMDFTRVATYQRVGWKLGAWHDVGWWQRKLGGTETLEPAEPKTLDEIDTTALLHQGSPGSHQL